MDSEEVQARPEPKDQAEQIKATETQAREDPVRPGTKTFLVSNTWFSAWCRHTGLCYQEARKRISITNHPEGVDPGPIDNADLLAPQQRAPNSTFTDEEAASVVTLRDGLVEKKNFWAFSEPTWKLLEKWYGIKGPVIVREYMQVGMNKSRVEMDPLELHIKAVRQSPGSTRDDGTGETVQESAIVAVSELCTVDNLLTRAAAAFGGSPDEYEMLDASSDPPQKFQVATYFKTLRGLNISDQQTVLLRRKQATGAIKAHKMSTPDRTLRSSSPPPQLESKSPSPASADLFSTSPSFLVGSPLSRSGGKAPTWAEDAVIRGGSKRRGLAGLANLGNTCFMNSSLQCLVHTIPIMKVFLSDAYKKDCNPDNPLGLGGKLACAFGGLMQKLWKEGASYVSPKHFKWELSKFAPQFQGYSQQDSQELLAFLLDGLHEDLNRIKVKPYNKDPDSNGKPDEEVAAASWAGYRARNDSVIVDHFQGMYKSTLVCPHCRYNSIKFDPFMYLSVPLPEKISRTIKIAVFTMNGTATPTLYAVSAPKNATIKDVAAQLGGLCLPPEARQAWQTRLCLACWPGGGGGEFQVFSDERGLDSKVADVLPTRSPGGGFSLRLQRPTQLLAYLYDEGDRLGPGDEGARPVVVHHRADYKALLPPSVFFMSEQALGELQWTQLDGSATAIRGGGGDSLYPWILESLRPYRNPNCTDAGAEPLLVVPSKDASNEACGMDIDGLGDAALATTASSSLEGAGGSGSSVPGSSVSPDDIMGEGGPMSILNKRAASEASSDASPNSVDFDMETGTSRSSSVSPIMSSARISPESSPARAPMPESAGFGMPVDEIPSSADGPHRGIRPAEAADMSAADMPAASCNDAPPPIVLKLANKQGMVRYTLAEAGDVAAPTDSPLSIVAEWNSADARSLDTQPWLHPVEHESVRIADEESSRPPDPLALQSCVEAFLQHEQLDADDTWYCSKCKDHVQADKKLDLWSLPEVLVVHLKRFSYSRYSRDKLDTSVVFPFKNLDLTPYLLKKPRHDEPEARYDLYAVSNHYGGMGGGHYTAYCKMPDDGLWYLFDDSNVHAVHENQVQSSAAYVLFYRRQGSKVGLERILQEGAGAEEPVAAEATDGDKKPALETIDSRDEMTTDPLHEELDIEQSTSSLL